MAERPVHGCPLVSWQHAWIHGVLSSTCSCIGMRFITAVEGHYPMSALVEGNALPEPQRSQSAGAPKQRQPSAWHGSRYDGRCVDHGSTAELWRATCLSR